MGITGVGVGWRPAIADLITHRGASLGFTEIVAENISPSRVPPALTSLDLPVVTHGVTLGLAGADQPDRRRLAHLAAVAEALGSPVVSEHVAFVRAADAPDPLHGDVLEAGHLLPPPRTRESLAVLVENVRAAQDQLPVPLAVENIAALFTWPEDTLSEPDFLGELVARTGVRLVLDLANLFASATARGSDPVGDLERWPLEAVAYVHVAGGEFRDGLYLDTHGHPLVAPVLELVAAFIDRFPDDPPGLMLERDSDVSAETVGPELDLLVRTVARCRV